MKILQLREDFIKFMRSKNHKLLPQSKIYLDDESLLFVNAGMNQLKDIFVSGEIKQEEKFRRLCNSQICIRAGGKHNDLDDVGKDSYHLTSFEMLGSWSLDIYEKEEAIEISYDYLVNHLKLDPNRIYITYFEGNDEINADLETKEIWSKFLPKERIIKGNFKDNFWLMANDGPCGPSTEIHYDISDDERFVPDLVNADDPTLIEIWNLVFVQYNLNDGIYEKLDKFFIDTGMGLERLAMVLQHKKTIYDTDAFHYLFGYCQALTNHDKSYSDSYDNDNDNDISYRIFADHMRTITIALFQDVKFDVTGRGSVLRKIMRRMLSHIYIYLNDCQIEPLMNKPIISALISDILDYFLFFKHDQEKIQKLLIDEERRFLNILFNLQKKIACIKNIDLDTIDDIENIGERNKVLSALDKLKADGIPYEIIKNRNRIGKLKKYD